MSYPGSFLLWRLPNQTSEVGFATRVQTHPSLLEHCVTSWSFFLVLLQPYFQGTSGGERSGMRCTSTAPPLLCALMWWRSWGELRLCHRRTHGRSLCSLYRGGCPTSESLLITPALNHCAYSKRIQHPVYVYMGLVWMHRFFLSLVHVLITVLVLCLKAVSLCP